ncbi:MAG TPA: GAF domain-containing protein, partial [Limnochordia bacterium]|nr:GAF domain-containing protein [Limnochordia bacterium]
LLLVPFHVDGQARGTIWIMSHDPNRRFEREDLRLTTSLGRFAATAYQVAAAHQLKASLTARQAIAAQQARELAAMQQLQEISTRLVQMDNGETLYDEILAAAIAMMDAEKATLQRFAAEDRSLRLIAFKGFDPADTVNWTTIDEHSGTICAAALRAGRRVLVPNAAHAELPADVFDPESMLGCGLRAGQTTPLVSRSGRLLGMLTTYWRRPHEPAERELRLLDVLARQAADFIERTGAEERLRFSEQRLSELLDSLPAAIYTTDAQGLVTFYNQATIEFAGRTPALGRDQWCVSWRLYHPDGAPMSHDQSPMAAALRADRPIRGMEAVLERPDGTRVPFIPFPTPLHDTSGKVVGAVNMLVDITERKRTETMLSGQKQVLEMLATGAPLDDVLSALLHLIESQSDGLLGGMFVVARESNRFALGVAPSLAPEYAELLLRAPVGPPYPTPCSYAASTAEPVAVADIASERRWSDEWRESALRAGLQSCRVSPILGSDGKPVGAFTLYDRRRRPIPSDLRLLQTATYLAGIAIERRQAEEALRESDQRKNEFLAMLAHELRNPLAPIRNGLGIVGRDHNAPAAVQTAVTMMRRQIDQMVRLVDDLLDVSRISRGKIALRKERFDLQSALSQAVEAALPLCERKSQQLSVTLPPRPVVLDADPARFVQVVGNLLN